MQCAIVVLLLLSGFLCKSVASTLYTLTKYNFLSPFNYPVAATPTC